MVGYSSHGYRLYDKNTRVIVTSRDVIFEEGVGHRTLEIPEDDDLVSNSPVPLNETAHTIPYPRQQIAPRVRPNDGPLHSEQAATISPTLPAGTEAEPTLR